MRRQDRAQRQAVSSEKAPFVERRNTDGAGDGNPAFFERSSPWRKRLRANS